MAKDLPFLINDLEMIGNFRRAPDANWRVLWVVLYTRLDLNALAPKVYPLAGLESAMAASEHADSLKYVVMTA